MKCLCGYEHVEEDEQGKGVGDKPFIEVDVLLEGIFCEVEHYTPGTTLLSKGQIKSCPKCGTLKIDI
jgi:hypothetical protein